MSEKKPLTAKEVKEREEERLAFEEKFGGKES